MSLFWNPCYLSKWREIPESKLQSESEGYCSPFFFLISAMMVESLFVDKPVQFQGPIEIIKFNLIQIIYVSFHLVYVFADSWIGLINLLWLVNLVAWYAWCISAQYACQHSYHWSFSSWELIASMSTWVFALLCQSSQQKMLSERYEEAIKTVHNRNTFKCTEILKENETNKTTGSRKYIYFVLWVGK